MSKRKRTDQGTGLSEPQVILEDGDPAYAVVPWDTWTNLMDAMEDARDLALVDRYKAALAAGEEELLPMEMVQRLCDGESPVKVWREHRGMTQAELARAADLRQAYVSELESGRKSNPTVGALAKIARVLSVDLDDLVPAGE